MHQMSVTTSDSTYSDIVRLSGKLSAGNPLNGVFRFRDLDAVCSAGLAEPKLARASVTPKTKYLYMTDSQ